MVRYSTHFNSMDIPRKVIDAVEFKISHPTPAIECMPYLKPCLVPGTCTSIMAQLKWAEKHGFFHEIGRKNKTFIRFIAAMKVLGETTIYNTVIRKLREHLTEIGKAEQFQTFQESIEKDVTELQSHEEEEHDGSAGPGGMPGAGGMPCAGGSSGAGGMTGAGVLPGAGIMPDAGIMPGAGGMPYTGHLCQPQMVIAPPSRDNPFAGNQGQETLRMHSLPGNQATDPPRPHSAPPPYHLIDQPITTSTGSQMSPTDASRQLVPRQAEKIDLKKLPGYIITSLDQALDAERCCEERRTYWWKYLLKKGQLPLSFESHEKIKTAKKKPGKKLIRELISIEYSVQELETLFEKLYFQEGLRLIRQGQGGLPGAGGISGAGDVPGIEGMQGAGVLAGAGGMSVARRMPGAGVLPGAGGLTEPSRDDGATRPVQAEGDPNDLISAKNPEMEAQNLHRDAFAAYQENASEESTTCHMGADTCPTPALTSICDSYHSTVQITTPKVPTNLQPQRAQLSHQGEFIDVSSEQGSRQQHQYDLSPTLFYTNTDVSDSEEGEEEGEEEEVHYLSAEEQFTP